MCIYNMEICQAKKQRESEGKLLHGQSASKEITGDEGRRTYLCFITLNIQRPEKVRRRQYSLIPRIIIQVRLRIVSLLLEKNTSRARDSVFSFVFPADFPAKERLIAVQFSVNKRFVIRHTQCRDMALHLNKGKKYSLGHQFVL